MAGGGVGEREVGGQGVRPQRMPSFGVAQCTHSGRTDSLGSVSNVEGGHVITLDQVQFWHLLGYCAVFARGVLGGGSLVGYV